MLAVERKQPKAEPPPPIPTFREKLQAVGDAIKQADPRVIDLFLVFAGVVLIASGAWMVYRPAGFIVGGIALFYLGAWHDLVVTLALARRA